MFSEDSLDTYLQQRGIWNHRVNELLAGQKVLMLDASVNESEATGVSKVLESRGIVASVRTFSERSRSLETDNDGSDTSWADTIVALANTDTDIEQLKGWLCQLMMNCDIAEIEGRLSFIIHRSLCAKEILDVFHKEGLGKIDFKHYFDNGSLERAICNAVIRTCENRGLRLDY